jgi:prepilin signal peptidase PulO-like enzyme (type II secretory pathway)
LSLILSIPIEIRFAVLFIAGCCFGAIVNLGIYSLAWRPLPISPWSRAPAEAPRRTLWDRIPVFGWLGLRREAKLYGTSSWVWLRPMLMELCCGTVFAGLYYWEIAMFRLVPPMPPIMAVPQFFLPARMAANVIPANVILATIRHEQFVAHLILFCFMLVATWIDIDEMNIPDGVTIPGTLLGLLIMCLWPYALLPQVNASGALGLDSVSSVWLTSPDEVPPPPGNPLAPPRCVQPWDVPVVTGKPALWAAIAGFCAWCMALLPGYWSRRHGFWLNLRVFTARVARSPATYFLLALAVVGAAAITWVWWLGGPRWAALASSLAGIVIGGGLVWLIRILASVALGREAMGFGDVTLLAMIGAFAGWQASIIVFFMAPLYALLIGISRLLLRGEREIPFGPFLCLAAATATVFWPDIWDFFGERYFSLGWRLIVVLLGCLSLIVVLLPPIRWIVEWFKSDGEDRPSKSKNDVEEARAANQGKPARSPAEKVKKHKK